MVASSLWRFRAVALLAACWNLQAERLPIRAYTTADGLASNMVNCIHQDTHGFLWFCSAEGLSRFDGYSFTNYHTADGLPGDVVRKLIETRAGFYWIATFDGLVRFDPQGAGQARFRVYPLGNVRAVPNVIQEDRDGGIWCGTTNSQGLFYLGPHDSAFHHVATPGVDPIVSSLLVDSRGELWIGTNSGLFRRDLNGSVHPYQTPALTGAIVMALLEDRAGRIWVGTRKNLIRMDDGLNPTRTYGVTDGLPHKRIESLLEGANGRLWVGTADGLARWNPSPPPGEREFRAYSVAEGLNAKAVMALAEDRDGNLWMATAGSGVMKMARDGFTTYTEADGARSVKSFTLSRKGELCALFRDKDGAHIGRFDGERFVDIRPAWPHGLTYFGWGQGQVLEQDSTGGWWIATGHGLARFASTDSVSGLKGVAPKYVYTVSDGLAGDEIFSIFPDSHQRIWIGTIGPAKQDGMAVWDRTTGKIHAFSDTDGLPVKPVPSLFAEDRAGNIWAALYHGGLARYRHGRFSVFGEPEGVVGFITAMFVDSLGRLWIGTSSRGLIRTDDPTADQPLFGRYGLDQGLSSSSISDFTEDRWGRIYAANGRGIDRFRPTASNLGAIERFTTADGIATGGLELAFRDVHDRLWFSAQLGLSEFVPAEDPPHPPPPVLITGLNVGGVAQLISDLGQLTVSGLRFPERPVRVDYVGLEFHPGAALRYEYMLQGADNEWSAPTDQRTVIYASLAPGSYQFLVRAVAAGGAISAQPASIEFRILPPLWLSWWFLLLASTVAAALIYALHRYTVSQAVAVANVRSRIATDLHDDIGASLSQIAVLSEVARHEVGIGLSGPLAEIAGITRELVDSMSDIVWAINPEHDHLSNLIYRMRRFATDLLGGQRIGLQFHSSIADGDLHIGAGVRREIYLVFKEAIHNILRHSGAKQVQIEVTLEDDNFVLCISDDGCGFDVAAETNGNGIASIRRRAAGLPSELDWHSTPGHGTTLRMKVQLERPLALLRGRRTNSFR